METKNKKRSHLLDKLLIVVLSAFAGIGIFFFGMATRTWQIEFSTCEPTKEVKEMNKKIEALEAIFTEDYKETK